MLPSPASHPRTLARAPSALGEATAEPMDEAPRRPRRPMSDTALALLGSVISALSAAVIVLAVAIVRTREKIVRLEEWARLRERDDR